MRLARSALAMDEDEDPHAALYEMGAGEEEDEANVRPSALSVARIPALVREATNAVDSFLQVLVSLKLDASSDGVDMLRDRVAARIDDVERFQQTLSAGPLDAIVRKQAMRLRAAGEFLGNPSKPLPPEIISSSTMARPRVARVAPYFGSALAKFAKVGDGSRKEIRVSRTAPKPLYRWERRRPQPSSSQNRSTQLKWSSLGESPDPVDADANLDEAATELRQCAEPGHYTRYSSGSSSPTSKSGSIEFQIVLTEEEFKALKFQRRQLDAEQRHFTRRQQSQPSPASPKTRRGS